MPRGKNFSHDHSLENEWENIDIHAGSKILSTIYKIGGPSKDTVILCHPYLSESKQFFLKNRHAAMYHDLGMNVVIFDFNGFGKSPFQDFQYQNDIDAVIRYFKNLWPNTKFIAHGVSFGASQVITYASMDHHLLDKIIVENCLDSNLSYYKKRNNKMYRLMKTMMIIPGVNKNHDYIKSASNIQNIAKALLIYNTEDDLTTIQMGQKIQNSLTIPKKMVIFDGKHLEAYPQNKAKYSALISSFISTD